MVKGIEGLSEDERKALRGSKFAPLPPPPPSKPSSCSSSRLAHPGGPVKTNKAVALAKFLERKLNEPGGLDSMKPELIQLAVQNAKQTVNGGSSKDGKIVRHVTSFDDYEDCSFEDGSTSESKKKSKKEKELKKSKKEKKLKISKKEKEKKNKKHKNKIVKF